MAVSLPAVQESIYNKTKKEPKLGIPPRLVYIISQKDGQVNSRGWDKGFYIKKMDFLLKKLLKFCEFPNIMIFSNFVMIFRLLKIYHMYFQQWNKSRNEDWEWDVEIKRKKWRKMRGIAIAVPLGVCYSLIIDVLCFCFVSFERRFNFAWKVVFLILS